MFGFMIPKLLLEVPLDMGFTKYENMLEVLLPFSSGVQCV